MGLLLWALASCTFTVAVKENENPDQDRDGYLADRDCDDNDPAVHPGAIDPIGDGIDSDCVQHNNDDDVDGQTVGEGDCVDNDVSVFQGALEIKNGRDDDCDGLVDDDNKIEQMMPYQDYYFGPSPSVVTHTNGNGDGVVWIGDQDDEGNGVVTGVVFNEEGLHVSESVGGDASKDSFGSSLWVADGKIFIGARGFNNPDQEGANHGAVYMCGLAPGGEWVQGECSLFFVGTTQFEEIGSSLTYGSYGLAVGAHGTGSVYIIPQYFMLNDIQLAMNDLQVLRSLTHGDGFGAKLLAEDINEDGFEDLLVSAPSGDRVDVYLSDESGGLEHKTSLRGEFGDSSGESLAVCQYGDGLKIIVGAPSFSDSEALARSGVVYIVDASLALTFGGDLYEMADTILRGDKADQQFGTDVSCLGDINGNGLQDIAIGAKSHAQVFLDGLGYSKIHLVSNQQSEDGVNVRAFGFGDVVDGHCPLGESCGDVGVMVYGNGFFGGMAAVEGQYTEGG